MTLDLLCRERRVTSSACIYLQSDLVLHFPMLYHLFLSTKPHLMPLNHCWNHFVLSSPFSIQQDKGSVLSVTLPKFCLEIVTWVPWHISIVSVTSMIYFCYPFRFWFLQKSTKTSHHVRSEGWKICLTNMIWNNNMMTSIILANIKKWFETQNDNRQVPVALWNKIPISHKFVTALTAYVP